MTLSQRIRFYQQLAVLMRAGVPLRGSLLRLKERMPANETQILSDKINAGDRIQEAFAAARFSPFECHLVAAGERSAQLDTIFDHLSSFWKRQLEMRQSMIRPLYYPIVVLHLTVLMLGGVELATLPFPVVIFHVIMRFVLIYAAGIGLYFGVRYSWSNEIMRRIWLRVPLVGHSLKTASAYRWITALRLEFGAGISLYRAVGDAWRATGDAECERLAEEGEQGMQAGVNLSTLMTRWKRLPRDWIDFIETGEISGALETAFKNLETEAGQAWTLAQERLSDWGAKILYFVVLLFVALQVGKLMYQVEIAPIVEAEKQIDGATK